MESYIILSIAVFVLLLCFSAFFSSAETAFFSLTRSQISALPERRDRAGARLARLLGNPRRLLIVLLTGNTLVNIAAATTVALATQRLMGHWGAARPIVFLIQIVIVTLVILFLGEVLPKLAAIRNPLKWAERASLILQIVGWILSPIVLLLLPMADGVARFLGVERKRWTLSSEEIRTLVEVGEEHGELEKEERELITSIFDFGETTVREIMIPRTDMVCVSVEAPLDEVIEVIRQKGHSRIPVYRKSIDDIIGILHGKDLLPMVAGGVQKSLEKIIREPMFVPEGKLIQELLREFQKEKMHMAIVVDEYGGTAGLVTLEDIIEEIVGEIQDEYDVEPPLWQRLDDHIVIADARLDPETLNEVLGDQVIPTEEDYETLGGFLLSELGEVPEGKVTVAFHNYDFSIEEVQGNRIVKVRIVKREALPETPA
jgi:gliding motility-associated protein GldE